MMEYIMENKEWIFSGIGVLVLTIIGGTIKHLLSKKKSNTDRSIKITGDNPIYIEKNDGEINIK